MQEITFFSDANLVIFWDYVKMLLKMVAPGFLIVIAVSTVGYLLLIIVKSFKKAEKQDDEIEIKHY